MRRDPALARQMTVEGRTQTVSRIRWEIGIPAHTLSKKSCASSARWLENKLTATELRSRQTDCRTKQILAPVTEATIALWAVGGAVGC